MRLQFLPTSTTREAAPKIIMAGTTIRINNQDIIIRTTAITTNHHSQITKERDPWKINYVHISWVEAAKMEPVVDTLMENTNWDSLTKGNNKILNIPTTMLSSNSMASKDLNINSSNLPILNKDLLLLDLSHKDLSRQIMEILLTVAILVLKALLSILHNRNNNPLLVDSLITPINRTIPPNNHISLLIKCEET